MAHIVSWLLVAMLASACGETVVRSADQVGRPEVGAGDVDVAGMAEQQVCDEVEAEHGGDVRNKGISARLCVSNGTPGAGEEVVFTVVAHDPDAQLFGLTECRPNALTFGDEEAICGIAGSCGDPQSEPPKEEGRFREEVRHVYEAAGEYTATLVLQSGSTCPHPYASRASLQLHILVSG